MPTHVGKHINGMWENLFTAYSYKELTTKRILKETETYNKTIKEYEDAGKEEGLTAKEFYNYLGMCDSWEEFVKSSLIDGMIKENKLKTWHNRKDDKFMWYLVNAPL